MATQPAQRERPHGVRRAFLRAPIWLYRHGLGWILGERFLLLTHIGRKTGRPRQAVLEVVHHDAASDTYFILSGWGHRSDWLLNVEKTPEVSIDIGRRHLDARAERIAPAEAAGVLGRYMRRYPRAFRQLGRFMLGEALPPGDEGCRRLAEKLPMVALRPVAPVH
ncbi:MAG TPA: nitroreductase family deazaflavin-dependent oxidoreductase [Polyangia bacterium]|jgi:deazaflavin-dependent oxidoreductase (nitroreductase family)|nr:nitroreductase family deazaflavin-dependent oxidoreductase [Polyangia bacterium]